MGLDWGTFLPAGIATVVTGAFSLLMRHLDIRKFNVEIDQMRAQARKTDVETDDLVSARLIRELDRLSENCEHQARLNRLQQDEIEQLRQRVIQYAMREASYLNEVASLKQELESLKGAATGPAPIGLAVALATAFPADIPHLQSEHESDESAGENRKV